MLHSEVHTCEVTQNKTHRDTLLFYLLFTCYYTAVVSLVDVQKKQKRVKIYRMCSRNGDGLVPNDGSTSELSYTAIQSATYWTIEPPEPLLPPPLPNSSTKCHTTKVCTRKKKQKHWLICWRSFNIVRVHVSYIPQLLLSTLPSISINIYPHPLQ